MSPSAPSAWSPCQGPPLGRSRTADRTLQTQSHLVESQVVAVAFTLDNDVQLIVQLYVLNVFFQVCPLTLKIFAAFFVFVQIVQLFLTRSAFINL